MANEATICDTFCIRVIQNAAAAETINVEIGTRAFTVLAVGVYWIGRDATPANSTLQVSKVAADATVTNLFGSALTGANIVTGTNKAYANVETNNDFSRSDSLRLVTTNANTQVEVVLYCTGNPQQTLTVS